MANIQITQLPNAGPITGTESVPIVQNGVTVQTTTGAIAASPSQTQTFLTVGLQTTLPNSRYIGVGAGLTFTDGGALGQYQISPTAELLSLINVSTGMLAKTSSGNLASRSIQVSGQGLSITNGSGVSGDPTIALDGLSATIAGLSGFGQLTLLGTGATVRQLVGTTDQIDIAEPQGTTGNPTFSIADNPVLPGVEGMVVPKGTTAERPGLPAEGLVRLNTTTSRLEVYQGSNWVTIGSGDGTVSSVNASGGTTGLSFSGGPITSSGTLTLGGTLVAANGGTGQSSYTAGDTLYASGSTALSKLAIGTSTYIMTSSGTAPQWTNPTTISVGTATNATNSTYATNLAGGGANRLAYQTGANATSFVAAPTTPLTYLQWDGTQYQWVVVAGTGTVTSIDVSGGTTGLTTSGGPVTTAGTITLAGTLKTTNGGTGLTSYTAGDMLYYASGALLSKLTLGTSGYVLTAGASAPQYVAQSTLSVGSATTAGTATNVAGGATGALVYQLAASTTTTLPLGTTNYVLTAGASAPQYVAQSTLSVGTATNLANGAANRIAYQTAAGTTNFIVAPTVANTYLEWSGSAFQWSANPLGTVTSVDASGGTTGLTFTGGPITTSGTLTLGGTLNVANGGTGATTLTGYVKGNGTSAMTASSTIPNTDITGLGTMSTQNASSVAITGGTATGLTNLGADYLQLNTAITPTYAYGKLYWSATGTLNVGLDGGASLVMPVGEVLYTYGKASSNISVGQVVVKTGVVGASGVIQFGPSTAGLTDGNAIVGIACEPITSGSFGRVVNHGVVRGFNLSAFNNNDTLWYDPAGGGALTATKPSAPNLKAEVGIVINNGSGGSGSMYVALFPGSQLGGTDSNVQITGTPANNSLLQYDSALTYWKNVSASSVSVGSATTATNLAGGTANQVPYQTGAGATSFIVAPTVANRFLKWDGSAFLWDVAGTGTVTSVDVSGGTTGLTFSGGPITSSGTITMAGTLDVDNGGTGQTSYTDGQLLIGNTATGGLSKSTLTAGSNITITNGNGTITIASTGGGSGSATQAQAYAWFIC